jgi:hypothetical protein
MSIEEYIYEEKLRVNISGMSCATVSLLPWAEMDSRKREVHSVAKSILGSRSVKPPRRKKATREYKTGPSHFFSPSAGGGGDS